MKLRDFRCFRLRVFVFGQSNIQYITLRVVQKAPKPPPEVQGGPGQTLGASKKCVPTENPEERVA